MYAICYDTAVIVIWNYYHVNLIMYAVMVDMYREKFSASYNLNPHTTQWPAHAHNIMSCDFIADLVAICI